MLRYFIFAAAVVTVSCSDTQPSDTEDAAQTIDADLTTPLTSEDACTGPGGFDCGACAIEGSYTLLRVTGTQSRCDDYIIDQTSCDFSMAGRHLTMTCQGTNPATLFVRTLDTDEGVYLDHGLCGARNLVGFQVGGGLISNEMVSISFAGPNVEDSDFRRDVHQVAEFATVRTGGDLLTPACQYHLQPL